MTLKELKDERKKVLRFDPENYEECLKAVKRNGLNLQYIHNQTEEICLAAVKEDGIALQFVQNKTYEICLEAVKQDGYALKFIPNQTEEICLVGVKQCGLALMHVKNQTREICLAAVKQTKHAIEYVRDLSMIIDDKKEEDNKLKNILFISGVHGNEIGSIYLLSLLKKELDKLSKDELKEYGIGNIEYLQNVNFEGIRNHSRNQVYTGNDLNRSYSTNINRNDIIEAINRNDIIIDMHSSIKCAPMFYINENQYCAGKIISWCKHNDVKYCVSTRLNDTIKMYASENKKISITWEQSGIDDINCFNIKYYANKFLKNIIPNITKVYEEDETTPLSSCIITSRHEGIFISCIVSIDNNIKYNNGDIIGHIHDPYTLEIVELIEVPENCTLSTIINNQYVNSYTGLATYQPV